MNGFALKIIALITMIIDHMGVVFPETFGFEFRVIGRIAFPIYVFLIAQGFRHTKNPIKFLARLFAFAIISEPVFDWALRGANSLGDVNFFANTNIFYTLFLGGAAITAYKKIREKLHWVVAALPVLVFAWLAEYIFTSDYGAYGVIFIFVMYLLPFDNFPLYKGIDSYKRFAIISMALLCLWQHEWVFTDALFYGIADVPPIAWMLIPVTLISVLLVAFYNGKRGPNFKWLFYWSYPVHLVVLAVLFNLY